MDRYNRAWRAPSPCSSQNRNFRGLRPSSLAVPHQAAGSARRLISSRAPRHFSQDFMSIRSVFSPCAHGTANQSNFAKPKGDTRSTQLTDDVSKRTPQKRHFKRSSPVNQPALSPRVSSLLNRTGNNHLIDLFKRQEIDLAVLVQMTLEELESLGVRGVRELKLAIDLIKFAKKFI
ncbi:uncharacterized protein LOC111604324 isoform X2 [Drosophila hydei]|uniref:Uncharacterized protein LOC111604324 isoform X2 n=1 Tax=Drosophila hydei TaxID=7224 RepID=A0A6J1M9X0_DROHY|nr:uncharacterized protein LOC111604324 isoform X2 [Drosophila hydei]